jgi:hypothetical protein
LKRRYTVIEAARTLGMGTDAVRKRMTSGTIEHERVDGTVYVWLDDGRDGGATYRHDNGTTTAATRRSCSSPSGTNSTPTRSRRPTR